MQLPEFDGCISAACAIANTDRLIVIGSQAVLAQTNAREIPKEVLMSNEVDVTTVHTALGLNDEKWRNISDEMLGAIEFHLGEDSPWHTAHGFYVETVDIGVAVLPTSWQDRVRSHQVRGGEFTAICPDAIDACTAKMMRGLDKDKQFTVSLIEIGLVDKTRC